MELNGKVAIVTGSSSGIGEGVARGLAAAGASVLVNSRSSPERGAAVAESLPDAIHVNADVADDGAARALVAAAIDRWGRLDVVINNAGTTHFIAHDDLDAVTDEVWERILGVNLLGAWHVTRAAADALRRDGGGAVVNVSSTAGMTVAGSSIPYAVSKAALNHLTRLLARVLAPEVRVNAVAPGLVIDTPWNEAWIDSARAEWEARNPLARAGTIEDVVPTVLHLVTSDLITGQVVVVDGGHTLL